MAEKLFAQQRNAFLMLFLPWYPLPLSLPSLHHLSLLHSLPLPSPFSECLLCLPVCIVSLKNFKHFELPSIMRYSTHCKRFATPHAHLLIPLHSTLTLSTPLSLSLSLSFGKLKQLLQLLSANKTNVRESRNLRSPSSPFALRSRLRFAPLPHSLLHDKGLRGRGYCCVQQNNNYPGIVHASHTPTMLMTQNESQPHEKGLTAGAELPQGRGGVGREKGCELSSRC